jgi:hypothetical protein
VRSCYCIKHERPIGDVKPAPRQHMGGGRALKPEEWLRMLAHNPHPPYYFVLLPDGRLVPEGWREPQGGPA